MVSVQEARAQIEARRKQIQQQRLPKLTSAQLRQQTRQSRATRKLQRTQFGSSKIQQLKSLAPTEKIIQSAERKVALQRQKVREIESFNEDVSQAQKAADKGVFPFGSSKRTRKFFAMLVSGEAAALQREREKINLQLSTSTLTPKQELVSLLGGKELPKELRIPEVTPKRLQDILDRGQTIPPELRILGTSAIPDVIPQLKVASTPGEASRLPTDIKEPTVSRFKRKLSSITEGLEEKKLTLSDPGGIVGILSLDKEVFVSPGTASGPAFESEDFTADVKPFVESGRGTDIITPREKTFFEKLGVNPEDKSAIELRDKVQQIQKQFTAGKFSEEFAEQSLNAELERFEGKQILKGISSNAALGAGFVIISGIPVVGGVANALLQADLFVRRRSIVKQFRKFPLESSLSTGAFIAGGLTAGTVRAGVKNVKFNAEINPQTIESVTKLGGKQKSKLTSLSAETIKDFKVAEVKGKITNTIAYEVKLKDGRVFQILEFSKIDQFATKGGVQGTKEFIGYEVGKPKGGEILVGRGAIKLQEGTGKTFIRVVRFKPSNTKFGRLVDKKFGRGKIIDILETSKFIKGVGRKKIRVGKVVSEARILKTQTTFGGKGLVRQVDLLVKALKAGKKINLNRIRRFINVERRLKRVDPFTEAEFKKAAGGTLTETQILSIMQKIRVSISSKIAKESGAFGSRTTIIGKEIFFGTARTKFLPKKLPTKVKPTMKKTPLSKTFPPAPKFKPIRDKLVRKQNQIVTQLKPRTIEAKIRSVLRKKTEQVTPSPSAIAAISQSKPFPVARIAKGALKGAVTTIPLVRVSAKLKQDVLNVSKVRELELVKSISSLAQASPQTTLTRTRLSNLQRSLQLQKLKQIQIQKMKITQSARIPRSPLPPIKIRIRPPGEDRPPVKTKIKPLGTPKKQIGYNALVKQKGKFIKVNKVPLTKNRARDIATFVADKSLGATWKIVKTNKMAKKHVRIVPKDYGFRSQRKFRTFQKKKGKQIPIKNSGIEKRTYRLDSFSERKKIQAARFAKGLSQRILRPIRTRIKTK